MILIIFFTAAIIGVLVVTLALAMCKTAARCSPREQAVMDDEQVREVSGKDKWAARLTPTFRDGLGMMEEDDNEGVE